MINFENQINVLSPHIHLKRKKAPPIGEEDYGFGRKFGWCADKFGLNWPFVLME